MRSIPVGLRGPSRAQPFRAPARPSSIGPVRMLGGKGGGVEHRECPKCKNLVHVNKSGKLGSHRVGVNMKQSWPCPGDDLGIE